MKKTDVAVVVALFLVLIGWIAFSPKLLQSSRPEAQPTVETVQAAAGTNAPAVPEIRPSASLPAGGGADASTGTSNAAASDAVFHAGSRPDLVSLSGTSVVITVSSWGGGITAVNLEEFLQIPTTNILSIDFSAMPALAYNGLPGLTPDHDFVVTGSNNTILVRRETEGKLRFTRSITFTKDYVARVTDEFVNLGGAPLDLPEHSINVGPMRNNKGETTSMGFSDLGIDSQARKVPEGPRHWGNGGRSLHGEPTLAVAFLPADQRGGCSCIPKRPLKCLDHEFQRRWDSETDWIAVKNKFFVQVLIPRNDEAGMAFVMKAKRMMAPAVLRCTAGSLKGSTFTIQGTDVTVGSASNNAIVLNDSSVPSLFAVLARDGWDYYLKPGGDTKDHQFEARRLTSGDAVQVGSLAFTFMDGERPDRPDTWASAAVVEEVSATMVFERRTLAPNESFVREFDYYVGPKKYPQLRDLGRTSEKGRGKGCAKIMEFGIWEVICIPLLWIMNALYYLVPNYGIAIILLTVLIRLVFWPVMQKSAENSRKMQELQPQLAALKEQYKGDQQQFFKKQQELFKQNKVSMLGGCLPMLIQMPILFSLFYVLRSAVELRGATFLWITDLSEAERLLPGILSFWPHHLNILPILMTVVQIWQMKITPTPGDQQMQKMMLIFMPLFMLYLLYDMASGLVLYWTVSQLLAILQIVLEKNRKHAAVVGLSGAAGKK
ncbi:MAG: membrane protein insertase YidC [bacterium]